jgi:NAD(P)-dependent dehydrogenase (short-subunit alcohol dehydrogenase family)
VLTVPGDVADPGGRAERAIAGGKERFGRIETIVNNAGIFIPKPFTRYTDAEYAATIGTNLTGFFHITQLALAEGRMREISDIVDAVLCLSPHRS